MNKYTMSVAQWDKRVKAIEDDRDMWMMEAAERGKDIEEFRAIVSLFRDDIEPRVYRLMCNVLFPYIKRNTNEKQFRRDQRKDVKHV